MRFIITDVHCSGRISSEKNEDRVFFYPSQERPNIFGVADGATSVTSWLSPMGLTSAQLAAEMVRECAVSINEQTDPQEWFDDYLTRTLALYGKDGMPEEEILVSTLALYNAYRNQIWKRHDCQYGWRLPNGEYQFFQRAQSVKELTYCRLRSARIARLLTLAENQGWRNDSAVRAHLATEGYAAVRKQRLEDLAAIIDGQTNFPHYAPSENKAGVPPRLEVITVPEGVTEIILSTDGMPKLLPTLDEMIAFRENITKVDPFHIGMGVNNYVTPKGVVDPATGDILEQGDDEAVIIAKLAGPHAV